MSWKSHFDQGVALFKQGKRAEALEKFNQALTNGGENQFIIYDSRAAVHESLNNPKEALQDAKTTIKVAPLRWQGYARAARLFMKTYKFDASLKMVDYALTHVKPEDRGRHEELLKLKREIANTQEAVAARERRMQNQMLKLPVEIYEEIFRFVMAEDSARIIKLLQVCRHWRRIIWETPGLWHTLVLSSKRSEEKATLWIERSNRRIRELHISSDYIYQSWPPKLEFFDDLDWSYLRVCKMHQPRMVYRFDPYYMFHNLEELEISAGLLGLNPEFFHPCTKLKSLSVHEASLQPEHLGVLFPSLSSLSLKDCSFLKPLPMHFFPMLNANPQLEHLSLNTVLSEVGPMPSGSSDLENPPSLKQLKTLDAFRTPWATFVLLLDIPMLQTLRLHYMTFRSPHLAYWISTSPKHLTELSLRNTLLEKDVLIRLVRTIPTIEVLELVELHDTGNAVINALVEMEATTEEGKRLPCLCPRLRHLDVSSCEEVETYALHALVKQRLALSAAGDDGSAPKVNKLEVLKMDGCPRIEVKWVPWFREHVSVVSCIYAPKRVKRGAARRANGL